MANLKMLLERVLVSIQTRERMYICNAIEQYAGTSQLAEEGLRYMLKYKPRGPDLYIGWWRMGDVKSRVVVLERAIKELG